VNRKLELKGKQLGTYVAALESAYSPERFDQMMLVRLSKHRPLYTLANDLRTRFFDVVVAAGMEGWAGDLVAASLDANPDNPRLLAFVRALGLDPVPDVESARLQKVVTEKSVFHNPDPFLMEFSRRVGWVCQVAVPNGGGTGVLVAEDLVLTNHHVVARVIEGEVGPEKVACIFDFKMLNDGRQISGGRRVALHTKWQVASRRHSPEDEKSDGAEPEAAALDYAVLRLAEPVGDEALGSRGPADAHAPARGWLTVRSAPPAVAENDPIIVVQHPLLPGKLTQEPVQLALGVALQSPFADRRLRHNARTLGGSSGSPCFNADLEFVALHHAGDPVTDWDKPKWNQAIPIGRLVADLAERSISPQFWDRAAPAPGG
jgi:hypothetical protein